MLTIVMRDKSLTANLSSPIYQYDNNADQIKCIVPFTYDAIDLKEASVTMFYKDKQGNGGFIELQLSDELFNKDYYQFVNKVNSKLTSHVGKLILWLKISDYINDFSFETGEASINILPCKQVPKNIQLEQLSGFNQWEIKMNQLYNEILKLKKDTISQSNITRKEAECLKKNIRIVVDTKYKKGGDKI